MTRLAFKGKVWGGYIHLASSEYRSYFRITAVVENTDQTQRSPSVQRDVQEEEQAGTQKPWWGQPGASRVPAAKSGSSQDRRVRALDPTYRSDEMRTEACSLDLQRGGGRCFEKLFQEELGWNQAGVGWVNGRWGSGHSMYMDSYRGSSVGSGTGEAGASRAGVLPVLHRGEGLKS